MTTKYSDSLVSTDWLAAHLNDADDKIVDGSWYLPTENKGNNCYNWKDYDINGKCSLIVTDFCKKNNIPTANFGVFNNFEDASNFSLSFGLCFFSSKEFTDLYELSFDR